MKRLLLMSTLVALALSVISLPAMAGKVTPNAERIPSLEVKEVDLGAINAAPIETCQVGNLNALAFAIPGFAYPPEEYALVFDPLTQCSVCPTGLAITAVHIFVRSSAACDIQLEVGMRDVGNNDASCPESTPDAGICLSGIYNVSLPDAGIYDVSLPLDCPCADPNYPYALSISYLSSSCLPEPDLITDGSPSACTSWNDYGTGWIDIVTAYGFPGNLSFYADAVCCEPPVPSDDSSWGAIKGLYGN